MQDLLNNAVYFVNDSVLDPLGFTVFGVHAKPNSKSPLGHFGTGIKYGIAVILREGGTIRIESDNVWYDFYTKEKMFRGTPIQQIRMKKTVPGKKPTYHTMPFTTALGKEWKIWQALRELESNCLDEGGRSFYYAELKDLTDEEFKDVMASKTVITVVHEEFASTYVDNMDTIFPKFHEKELLLETDNVNIYRGESKYLYYRGVRAFELDDESLFTYNFKDGIGLTEDRTLTSAFMAAWEATRAVIQCDHEELLTECITATEETFEHGFNYSVFRGSESREFIKILARHSTIASPYGRSFWSEYSVSSDEPSEREKLITRIEEWLRYPDDDEPDEDLNELMEDILTYLKGSSDD